MCAVIAHLQPEGAIIVDESLTSGGAYWDLSKVHATACYLFSMAGSITSADCSVLAQALPSTLQRGIIQEATQYRQCSIVHLLDIKLRQDCVNHVQWRLCTICVWYVMSAD